MREQVQGGRNGIIPRGITQLVLAGRSRRTMRRLSRTLSRWLISRFILNLKRSGITAASVKVGASGRDIRWTRSSMAPLCWT